MAKKAPDPCYKLAVEAWFNFYRHKTGEEYVFDTKDGFHLKQLLNKIRTKIKQKSMEESDTMVMASFKGFLLALTDKWILEHLEISIVNSKFNSLYVSAVRTNPFTAGSRIDDIIERRHSSGAAGQNSGT